MKRKNIRFGLAEKVKPKIEGDRSVFNQLFQLFD